MAGKAVKTGPAEPSSSPGVPTLWGLRSTITLPPRLPAAAPLPCSVQRASWRPAAAAWLHSPQQQQAAVPHLGALGTGDQGLANIAHVEHAGGLDVIPAKGGGAAQWVRRRCSDPLWRDLNRAARLPWHPAVWCGIVCAAGRAAWLLLQGRLRHAATPAARGAACPVRGCRPELPGKPNCQHPCRPGPAPARTSPSC